MDRLRMRMRYLDRVDGEMKIKDWVVWWGPDLLVIILWMIAGALWAQLFIEGRL